MNPDSVLCQALRSSSDVKHGHPSRPFRYFVRRPRQRGAVSVDAGAAYHGALDQGSDVARLGIVGRRFPRDDRAASPPPPRNRHFTRDRRQAQARHRGRGRGIGRAVALQLAKRGLDVALWSRTVEETEQVAAEVTALGRRALGLRCDVANAGEVAHAAERLKAVLGVPRAVPRRFSSWRNPALSSAFLDALTGPSSGLAGALWNATS